GEMDVARLGEEFASIEKPRRLQRLPDWRTQLHVEDDQAAAAEGKAVRVLGVGPAERVERVAADSRIAAREQPRAGRQVVLSERVRDTDERSAGNDRAGRVRNL